MVGVDEEVAELRRGCVGGVAGSSEDFSRGLEGEGGV